MSWYGSIYCGLVAYVCFWIGVHSERHRKAKVGTPSASHNSVSREIKCSNRECDFRNKNGVCTNKIGSFCSDRRTLHPA